MRDSYFERDCRTPYSECYAVEVDGNEIGRVDLHFTAGMAYATLCVGEGLSDDDLPDLSGARDAPTHQTRHARHETRHIVVSRALCSVPRRLTQVRAGAYHSVRDIPDI